MTSFSRPTLRLLAAIILFSSPLSAFAAPAPKLLAPPEGERWFSINVGGERVGFSHQSVTKTDGGYRIDSEGSVKMRVMGFSREATSKESYLVGPDLALRTFASEFRLDGSPLVLKGEVIRNEVRVEVESGGRNEERFLKTKGAIYPPQALNIYPLMHGASAGKSYKIPTFDVESVKVTQSKVEVIGEETLPPGISTIHLRNNIYPMVDNDVWVDLKGNTLRESIRDDLVVTLAEDAKSARLYLADAALAKLDLVLDFSLIRVTPPIEHPGQLKMLSVEFTGIPVAQPLLEGSGQHATRVAGGGVIFTMPYPTFPPPPGESPTPAELEPSSRIPSDAPEITARKSAIIGAEKDSAKVIRLLAEWVAREIKGAGTDSQSPLETLKSRTGNCQSHARLYTALARAAGIPTRFVSGLVYLQGEGFLYHSWAESYLHDWVTVDPTFGEVPCNVTHIKLVEGDTPDEMGMLTGMIGRVKAKVLELKY
jgi:transglutaminase-like putative cysteine protease